MKEKSKKIIIILLWILLWQVLALQIHNEFYFASPIQVVLELGRQAMTRVFWLSILNSILRILGGFFVAFFMALVLTPVAYKNQWLKEFLQPIVQLMKSVPIAAVVVIILIWFGSEALVQCVTAMVVFPNVYLGIMEGLSQVDEQKKEVAVVYQFPVWTRILYLYRPTVHPYLRNSVRFCIGMSFKSGIAAEIIGLPKHSMGEALYSAKIYLNTAGVFAWTIVIILISSIVEKGIIVMLEWISQKEMIPKYVKRKREKETYTQISCEKVTKYYGKHAVFQDLSIKFNQGERYCIMGESGCGKTTLLRILAGLDNCYKGKIDGIQNLKIGMVFQEPRLFMECNALTNFKIAGCASIEKYGMAKILPIEAWEKPLKEYSGGMLQKVAILRALFSQNDILLMDEPFTGLDEENRKKMVGYILKKQEGRTLIVVTHETKDAVLLDAKRIQIDGE